jgi:hypothetical protein
MSADGLYPRPWPVSRLWLGILFVFVLQIGLIFALVDRKERPVRQPAFVPELRLADRPGEWLALSDPTLFALPSREGFSAAAWLQLPDVAYRPFEWREPARSLDLPAQQLGTVLARFMQTNAFSGFAFEAKPTPTVTQPPTSTEAADQPEEPRSVCRVDGDLSARAWLNPPELPSLPAADLLRESVVQVLVDAAGHVLTMTLLSPASSTKDPDQRIADQRALDLAKLAHFAPLSREARTATTWTRGTLTFQWQTLPLPATNSVPATP